MLDFLLIGIFLLLGAVARHLLSKKYPLNPYLSFDAFSNNLNHYVISICLPAIVFLKIPSTPVEQSLLIPALIPWFLIAVAIVFVLVASRLFKFSKATEACLLMIACFGNTSFFGFPIVRAFYGESALSYAVVYDLFGSFLSLAIVGNIIIAVYSQRDKFSWLAMIKRVLTFPPFLALCLALLLKGMKYPMWLIEIFQLISLTLVPTAMLLVGMHMSFRINRILFKPLLLGVSLKLWLLPMIAWIFLTFTLGNGINTSPIFKVTIFDAAMPPMVTACLMAIQANLNPKLAATAVGAGLVFSFVTLPTWYWLLS
ncbi:MAG: AEC family transporter [Kangiellaceae bacterium]|nr:AEC family transporter [Kangiellaceae bacterium]